MSDLLLSRTLAPSDYNRLGLELAIVDHHGIVGQHPHRRWEYALTLHAIRRFEEARERKVEGPVYDVGGGGSLLSAMIAESTGASTLIIDPSYDNLPFTLEAFTRPGTPLAEVITCISVIEHVPNLDHFLYLLTTLLAPGGLLVLTMDYWNRCGKDTAENKDLRVRIFCPKGYAELRAALKIYECEQVGGVDPVYHGAQVYDYTFASLVVRKRP